MSKVITPPTTYAEWVGLLDMLKGKMEDEAVKKALKQGVIAWQSGVAERFSQKLIDAVNARMDVATDKFQKDISRARGQESAIIQALISLRKEMSFLVDVMDLPAIPEKDRTHYCALVQRHANSMQSSLESSAKADRSGKMSILVRNNKVNAI